MQKIRFALPIALVAIIALPLHAQVSLSAGPLVGYYQPFGHFDAASVYSTDLARTPRDLSGAAYGATFQLTLGEHFGVEGIFAGANSEIPGVNSPGGVLPPTRTRVALGALIGQYDVAPPSARWSLRFGAGPARVQYERGGYARYDAPASWGAAGSVDGSVPVLRHIELTAGVTGFLYTFDLPMPAELQKNPGKLQHGAQRDALVQIGARWRP